MAEFQLQTHTPRISERPTLPAPPISPLTASGPFKLSSMSFYDRKRFKIDIPQPIQTSNAEIRAIKTNAVGKLAYLK